MSKQIDERVVSMQFDNRQFESNVKTTMSTLEKLKQSLNLSGASKGLESVSVAASKCNLSPLGSAVESVKVKFSAMEVMAITALTNITNSAVNAGKRIVESLTITPITTGFNEYELKMGAIQTIMASTGESLATVNQYLNELNKYSDQTIYSFQDMTQNIGKFTNAGVKLEDAVLAIKGIANEAAVSGANANEASRAMYNFAQALSTGYVQRIDWKSIELANMATVEFKEQLLSSAIAMGTVEKNAEGMWRAVGDDTWYNTSQMFIETLDEQWLTSEVLIDSLKDYADETTEIGKKASAAATEVKTFTMLMDTLKESAQSGWATTWETIVGDFDESKNLFTSLSNVIGGWLDKSADKRNNLLSEVLDSNWEKTIRQLNEAGISAESFEEAIRGVVKNSSEAQKTLSKQGKTLDELVEEYGSLQAVFESGIFSSDLLVDAVDEVIGEFEQLELTVDRLLNKGTSGDDVKQMQKILKQLGHDLGEFGENADGLDGIFGSVTQAAVREFQAAKGLTVDGIVGPETLAALQQAADELNEANEESKGLVQNIKDLVKNVDNLGGRKKLLETITKLWGKIGEIIDAVKKGYDNIFGDADIAGTVTKIIDKFSNWVDEIVITKETLGDVESIISGICSAIQTGAILGGGLFGVLYKIVNTAIRLVGIDLISVLGNIGDALVKFRNFLISDNALADWLEKLGTMLSGWLESFYAKLGAISDVIKQWFYEFIKLEKVQAILERLSDSFGAFKSAFMPWAEGFGTIFSDFFSELKSLDSLSFKNILTALEKLWSDLTAHFGSIGDLITPITVALSDLGEAFIEAISKFKPIGNVIEWFQNAKKAFQDWRDGIAGSEDLPKRIADSIVNGLGTAVKIIGSVLKSLWNKILSVFTGDSITDEMTEGGKTIADGLITGLVNGVWDGIRFVGEVILEIGKTILDKIKDFLGIHSPSTAFITIGLMCVAGLVLGFRQGSLELSTSLGDMVKGIIDSITNSGLLETIKAYGKKILEFFGRIDFADLFALGGIGLLAFVANKISKALDIIAGGFKSVNSLVKNAAGILDALKDSINRIGKAVANNINAMALKNLATAIAILVGSIVVLTFLDPKEMWTAVGVIAALAAILGVLFIAVNKLTATNGKNPLKDKSSVINFGKMAAGLFAIASAMLVFAAAAKIIGGMEEDDLVRAIAGMGAITVMMIGLIAATNLIARTDKGDVAKDIKKVGKMLQSVAIAMIIMVVAAKMIAKMTWDDMAKAGAGLVVLAGIMVGLIAATKLIAKTGTGNTATAVYKAGKMLMGMTLAMLILVFAAKMIAKMSWDDMSKAGAGLTILAGIMVGLVASTKLIAKTGAGNTATSIYKVGTMLLGIAAAMMLLVVAGKTIADMEWNELAKAGIGLTVLAGIMVGLIAATKLIARTGKKDNISSEIFKVGTMLLAMASAMLILTFTAKILAGMSWGELGKAAIGLVALGGVITGLVAATKLASDKDIIKSGITLMFMSVAIVILSGAVMLLGHLDLEALAKGVIAVALLGAVMAGMIMATRGVQDCHENIMKMAIAIGVMAIAVAALSFIDADKLLNATASLISVMLAFAILLKVSEHATGKMGILIVLTGAIAILGGVLYLLATLPIESTIGAAIALSVLLLAFTVAMRNLNKLTALDWLGMLKTMGVLILVVGALAGVLYLLKTLDPKQAIGIAAALSLFLYAMIGALTLVGKIKPISVNTMIGLGVLTLVVAGLATILHLFRNLNPGHSIGIALSLSLFLYAMIGALAILSMVKMISINAMAGLVIMTLVVGALAGILYLMRELNPEQAIGSAAALSVLLLALSAACAIASLASGTTVTALASIVIMTLVVGALAGILYLLRELNPEQAIGTTTALSTLLLSLSAACAILGVVGLMGPAAFIGIGALITLVTALGTLIAGIGALVTEFPQLDEFLNVGIPILEKIGRALGSFFGNIIGGFAEGITDGLPGIGSNLSAFMNNAKDFIDGANRINENTMVGVRTLAETILILTAADILDGLTSWITGGSSLSNFGTELASFGPNLKTFADSVAGIDSTSVSAATEAAKAIVEMANVIPNEGGMAAWFAGENSLAAFGPQVASFGGYLKTFADNVAGIDPTVVTAAAEAGKALAEMANTVPNEGGMAAWFAGENSLAAFGSNLPGLGSNLANFVSNLGTFTDDQKGTIACAAEALKTLAIATDTIPNDGGLSAWFAGENSLATFSTNLPNLGMNMASFVTNLGTFTEGQVATVACVADAIKVLALATNTIPNEGGVAAWFAGENSLAAFSANLPTLGTNMATFVANLGTFTESQVSTVYSAVNAIKAFATLADSDLGGAKKHIEGFGNKLAGFGSDLKDFCSNLGANSGVDAAVSNMKKIVSAAKSITDGSIAAVKNLAKSLKEFGKNGVKEFVSAFTSNESKTNVKNAAAKLAQQVIDGAETKKDSIKKSFETLASAGASAIKTSGVYDGFVSAGKYLVSGFAAGITENTFMAEARAIAMAQAALAAAKAALAINSPSKVFREVGMSVPEGFAMGIEKLTGMVVDSSMAMTKEALDGTKSAIAKIAEYIDTDIDSNPVIRPVLDLSDVTSGASTIGSLFNTNPSVGVLSNVGVISSMMNRNQNGVDSDIVSAIKDLKNSLSGTSGDVISINGITYDDGSNVADAVKSLVRAARVERRI